MTHGNPSSGPVETTDLFIDSGGVRLAVRDYGGRGQPLVFVHGGPGPNLTSWDAFARRMVGPFRAVAYDQRGHGQSDDAEDYSYDALAGDIQAIVEALRLNEPIVVGHSWGGLIGLKYAALYSSCAGVVCVDGFSIGKQKKMTEDDFVRLEEQLRTHPVISRAIEFAGTPAELDDLLDWVRTKATSDPSEPSAVGLRRGFVEGSDGLLRLHHSIDHFMAMPRAVEEHDLPGLDTYNAIRCPVLLAAATEGGYKRNEVENVLSLYPKLQVEWLKCGHGVQFERPDELADVIIDFAARLDAPI